MPEPTPTLIDTLQHWIQGVAVPAVPVLTLAAAWFSPVGRWFRDKFGTSSAERAARFDRELADDNRRDTLNRIAFERLKADLDQADREVADKDRELEIERQRTAKERASGNRWYQIAIAWFSYYMERRVLVMQALRDADARLRAAGLPGTSYNPPDQPEFEKILDRQSDAAGRAYRAPTPPSEENS